MWVCRPPVATRTLEAQSIEEDTHLPYAGYQTLVYGRAGLNIYILSIKNRGSLEPRFFSGFHYLSLRP